MCAKASVGHSAEAYLKVLVRTAWAVIRYGGGVGLLHISRGCCLDTLEAPLSFVDYLVGCVVTARAMLLIIGRWKLLVRHLVDRCT